MRKRNAGRTGLALVGILAILLPSCSSGNSGGNTTGPNQTPSTPTRTVITQRTFQLGVLQFTFLDVTVTGAGTGTLDGLVNWTFATNDVDLYATTTSCPDGSTLLLGGCTVLARATGTTTKPERISFSATAGNYRFWIINYGPGSESGTLEVGLTQ